MSRVKDYAAELYPAGDGVADFEQMEFELAYKQWELEKLQKELA